VLSNINLLSFLHNSSLQEDSCMHSLRKLFEYFQVLNSLTLCTLCDNSLSTVRSGHNSEAFLGLCTPCMAPVLNLHFYEDENNVISSELSEMKLWTLVNACLVDKLHCTPCRKTLAQTEKQLKLIPYSPSLQISDIKYEIKHSRIKANA
jgi:hypothetical protein